jgi:AmmeMemoRadiSam system protein A
MSPLRCPFLAADAIIELDGDRGIVLIERENPPPGWAIPGGFVDYGESVEAAAVREAKEETGLDVTLTDLLYVYSDPTRDPRQHTVTPVFIGAATGEPHAADDAKHVGVFTQASLPAPLAFDHARVLADYFEFKSTGRRPSPAAFLAAGPLSADDKRALIDIARAAVAKAISPRAPWSIPADVRSPQLLAPRGAFVTLHVDGELRGCIGTLIAEQALWSVVAEMAASAATRDGRFEPIAANEIDRLSVEISALSPMRRVRPDEVEPGRHGLLIVRGNARGVLLPQVAVEHGWGRDVFLAETCRKARLPSDAWRDPATEVFVFEADVFGEFDRGS